MGHASTGNATMGTTTTGTAAMGATMGAPAASAPAGELIKDTTAQDFAPDVIEESRNQTVLVDFWAPWCGPCRQLTPIIEAAVQKAGGRVKLVKMNIEDHPAVSNQLGIQSIPAVIAFKDGQPVDGFMGAQSASQVDEFIEKVAGPAAPSQLDQVLAQAKEALETGDISLAAQAYAAVLQAEPETIEAIAGMIECYLATEQVDKASELLDMVREQMPDFADDPALVPLATKIELIRQAEALGDTGDMRATLEKEPDNHQARFDLALALNGRDDKAGAVDELLYIIKQDREWNDDGARAQLLQFFEAWGSKDPATKAGRRKMSALLFS
ncbi:MAG: thioredoxin [Rhizobiales bacterium]|nr:thioredoxin [Hyphomicrobiales bacterium]